jgi:hypothetical protein
VCVDLPKIKQSIFGKNIGADLSNTRRAPVHLFCRTGSCRGARQRTRGNDDSGERARGAARCPWTRPSAERAICRGRCKGGEELDAGCGDEGSTAYDKVNDAQWISRSLQGFMTGPTTGRRTLVVARLGQGRQRAETPGACGQASWEREEDDLGAWPREIGKRELDAQNRTSSKEKHCARPEEEEHTENIRERDSDERRWR